MNNFSQQRQTLVNILAAIIVFTINTGINLLLSPFIVRTLGVSANGYIQLANNFITYASLVTIALNSMSSRFITVEYHQKNINKAKEYYTSVFIGNIVILIISLIISIIILAYLPDLITIPQDMVISVKVLFATIFLNYFITIGTPDWSVVAFATGKVYIQSIANILSNIIKAIIIVIMYSFLPTNLFFVGVAATAATIALKLYMFYKKSKLLPELTIERKSIKFDAIIELISSGIWNTVNQVGILLSQGLDLLISNIMLGSAEMGILSLVKMFPTLMSSFSSTLMSVFAPNLTIYYAKQQKEKLISEIYKASKLSTCILTLPFTWFMCFGTSFFRLWVPSQNAEELQILSIISCIGLVFTMGIQVLYQIFTTVNKLKLNSLVFLVTSFLSFTFTIILVNYTDLGLIAICGISSFFNILKNLFFVVPFSAKYLGLKSNTFYPLVFQSIRVVSVLLVTGFFLSKLLIVNSWITLLLSIVLFGGLGLLINFFTLLNENERMELLRVFTKER